MAIDQVEPAIRLGEWCVIGATLLGPVLAVQAQKWVERRLAKSAMKDSIFRTLMATRAARLSGAHVEALNMIPLAFYGKRILGRQRQTDAELRVYAAHREYFDSLNENTTNFTEAQFQSLIERRDELFITLLAQIATAQNFDFDRVELKRGAYTPMAHNTIETDQEIIRTGLARILGGKDALPMRVVNLPSQDQK